jgi:hypothetical protein
VTKPSARAILAFEAEVTRAADGTVTIRPGKPVANMNVKAAAKLLGITPWLVQKLWRAGLLKGCKPGAVSSRKDGRASNAALVLDAQSVLDYQGRLQAAQGED